MQLSHALRCSISLSILYAMQMDGFDQTVNVKVIMATNRADTLDPALLRPGRLDRKIEFPLPDRRQKRLVFQVSFFVNAYLVCFSKMLLILPCLENLLYIS
jgi:AAA+ superfamily predicted ATPase